MSFEAISKTSSAVTKILNVFQETNQQILQRNALRAFLVDKLYSNSLDLEDAQKSRMLTTL